MSGAAPGRAGRAGGARELILAAAERLFAEHGVHAVTDRQIGEAAGQGGNAAVGYHFGARADLVRAIARKHGQDIEAARVRMVGEVPAGAGVRDWVACLVHPLTGHLAALGRPTWFARFGAQVMTDPALRGIVVEEGLGAPSLHRIAHGLGNRLPADVRAERGHMARQLMVHVCAERERSLAEGTPTSRASWHATGTGLVDALAGVWSAPVTTAEEGERR